METLLRRNNAPLGFDRLRHLRRASPTTIPRPFSAYWKSPHRLHNQYQRASTAILANESASSCLQFLHCNTPDHLSHGRCARRRPIPHVIVSCAQRSRLHNIQCHMVHDHYRGQHQSVSHCVLQLGVHMAGWTSNRIRNSTDPNGIWRFVDAENLSAAVCQLLCIDILYSVFQGEIYRISGQI